MAEQAFPRPLNFRCSTWSNLENTMYLTPHGFAKLDLDENSKHLLSLVAFLQLDHDHGIPESVLTQPHELPSLKYLNDKEAYGSALYDLMERGLVGRREDELQLNERLRFKTIWACYPGRLLRPQLLEELVAILNNVIPAASPIAHDPTNWYTYHQHANLVIAVAEAIEYLRGIYLVPPPMPLGFAKILSAIGPYFYGTGNIRRCREAMVEATAIINQEMSRNPQSVELNGLVGDICLLLGMVSDRTGVSLRQESLEYRERLVEQRKLELASFIPTSNPTHGCKGKVRNWNQRWRLLLERSGVKHSKKNAMKLHLPFTRQDSEIRLFIAKTELAGAYLQRGDISKTRIIMDELHTTCQIQFGSDDQYHYEWSRYYHHMAFVLMAEGEKDKAIEYISKSRDLNTMLVGAEDPIVLSDRYDLASFLFYAGRAEEALEEHQEVLRLREQICDDGNQYTWESHEAVGILLHLAGRDAEAEQAFENCVGWWGYYSHSMGSWTFEGVARANYWSSRVLTAVGRDEEASMALQGAEVTKGTQLAWFSDWLEEDPHNPAAVYDRMLPVWVMQTTGFLVEGGRRNGEAKVVG